MNNTQNIRYIHNDLVKDAVYAIEGLLRELREQGSNGHSTEEEKAKKTLASLTLWVAVNKGKKPW